MVIFEDNLNIIIKNRLIMDNKKQGFVFNIQRFVLHDGPGIRTTIFLKGCPLRCKWCHNPEGIETTPELIYRDFRCISCEKCIEVCPEKAIKLIENGIYIDRKLCSLCFNCINVCNSNALEICGDYMSIDKIISDISSDQEFYKQSGGGITISGGEPLMQYDFLLELLREVKKVGLHVCLDTSGNIESEKLKQIIKYVDIILYDIKTLDDDRHIKLTGVSNRLILKNLRLCITEKIDIIIRIPIIPDYNFIKIKEELSNHIQTLVEMGINKFELIPYHKFGEQKYKMLGKNYQLSLKVLDEERLLNLVNELKKAYNISIQISKPIIT